MTPPNEARSNSGLTISSTLFQRISDLDSQAWATFVHAYGPVIYKWCRKDGLSDEEAADVGQDVFRGVATGIQRYDRSAGSNFLGWLRTITRFKVADHFRQSSRSRRAVGGTTFLSVIFGIAQDIESVQAATVSDEDTAEANALVTARTMSLLQAKVSREISRPVNDMGIWQPLWR